MILSRLLQKGCPGISPRISPEFEHGDVRRRPVPSSTYDAGRR
jgi:hypothetical protein